MICYGTPDHNSGCSSTVAFDNALRNVPFTGIAPDTNSAIMVPQIEAGFVRKDNLLPISTPSSYAHWTSVAAGGDGFCVRGILYKGILARSPRCNRRLPIDEAHNETPVAVNHCAANCLEEAVWSI
ncbi:hypothetical protein TNCV_4804371 [Trichonephila clavipes]|nr:hypothetical protein TNCV_4804371 [Trichonephila clavipes]